MNVEVEEMAAGNRWWITFGEKTPRGEQLMVELTRCEADPKDKKALPYVAKKNGWSDKPLSSWWSVQTYTTDDRGHGIDLYNPTIKSESYETYKGANLVRRCRYVADFNWWLEATEENARKLLEEIERRAYQS